MRNLTELSLRHRALVWYFIIVFTIGGVFAYNALGRMEDPAFTIRQMVVTAVWPGATAEEMQEQVTDKLERRFQDTPGLKDIQSETRAGQTIIYIQLRSDIDDSLIRPTWRDVRNFGEDIKSELPDGVYGPYYNDRFDDVYGSIYAITGADYSYEELRAMAETARHRILTVPSVQKVILLGVQPERIYVEISLARLAQLGIPPTAITNALHTQDSMTTSGTVETETDTVQLRASGVFESLEDIRALPIAANGNVFRLGDIATVERRTATPPEPMMFYNGAPAIGIAVSMEDGGNILALGSNLAALTDEIRQDLPLGMELNEVSNQPAVVQDSIHDFVETLALAIIIVLAVSFLSLGFRTGLVVAGCIPLVLAGTFVAMYMLDIDLHKVSLGALIIALGLLVDDAIIAVEMMSVQLERGMERFDAACYAFTQTAKPMLTGTLITCAGFIPVAFSKGMSSEFCRSLFPVIGIALVLSWIVSVMVAPLFGYYLIRVKKGAEAAHDPYQSRFYRLFRRVLTLFLSHRAAVLIGTVLLFAASIAAFPHIKQTFFPPSLRPEILVELTLPQGASIAATEREAKVLSAILDAHSDKIANYAAYVGRTSPRFVLPVNVKADADNRAQFVITANGTEEREELAALIAEAQQNELSSVRIATQYIQTGPPADFPVMLRVSASSTDEVRRIAEQVAAIAADDPATANIHLDWTEKSKAVQIDFDKAKLKLYGISARDVKQMLYTELTGAQAAEFYTGDRTIGIVLRLADEDRTNLERLGELPIATSGGYVPLAQIAHLSYAAEDGLIKRRNLLPTIMVQGDVVRGEGNDATQRIYRATEELRASLPAGASITPAGALEDSAEAMGYLMQPVPAMVFIIMTLLMLQVGTMGKMALTLLTAPLGLIGVALAMLLTDSALGFVAYLGVLALFGMIIRNSVILIDQIKKHEDAGEKPLDAIIDSAVLRFRPIMLTAAAAILGMLPLMRSIFWGPMAVAIAGGLIVATVLTLLVLPVMYAVAYRVKN
ncbi:RND transporter, Hydrophobe/Amphiphile Efflux-1 (HAE1)/Heavy Metal Efflux (HME) family, permease protein [Selenomonas sp. FOBRC6]|uniref:efflux RND transporter permease subunit n=1 Tax=Selenomonas sp. FOBRC6 TaxID=936572 RepID=UPI000277F53B|nr:efflux RND transporter permease subunit [Selenomonas sp. FOBRC6]EJO22246.1 RND transporter, Hydrophobe/Amphiphile Efflux-1 (HAE1)/Heavy Metal Efflux (HME) family, permease protein [Selenomonas sp. FOBRC6]